MTSFKNHARFFLAKETMVSKALLDEVGATFHAAVNGVCVEVDITYGIYADLVVKQISRATGMVGKPIGELPDAVRLLCGKAGIPAEPALSYIAQERLQTRHVLQPEQMFQLLNCMNDGHNVQELVYGWEHDRPSSSVGAAAKGFVVRHTLESVRDNARAVARAVSSDDAAQTAAAMAASLMEMLEGIQDLALRGQVRKNLSAILAG